MKNRKTLLFLLPITALLLVVIACRKQMGEIGLTNNPLFGKMQPVNGCLTSSQQVRQFKWIARGLAWKIKENTSSEAILRIKIEPTEEDVKDNVSLQSQVIQVFNYEQSTKKYIDSIWPGNGYDSTVFYGFCYQDSVQTTSYVTELEILNPGDVTKKRVITYDNLAKSSPEAWGYFINNSGNLDSVWLDEDNAEDSFMVYKVTHRKVVANNGGGGGCAINGICEKGETENCDDCKKLRNPLLEKSLYVLSFTHVNDKKNFGSAHPGFDYQEAFMQAKYEIKFNIFTVDTIRQLAMASNDKSKVLKSWGNNCPIKRTKQRNNGSIKSNRGIENYVQNFSNVSGYLAPNYFPTRDAIFLLMYEADDDNDGFSTNDQTASANYYGPLGNWDGIFKYKQNGMPYTSNALDPFARKTSDNKLVIIPPNANWKAEPVFGVSGKTIEILLDGEMIIKFGYQL